MTPLCPPYVPTYAPTRKVFEIREIPIGWAVGIENL